MDEAQLIVDLVIVIGMKADLFIERLRPVEGTAGDDYDQAWFNFEQLDYAAPNPPYPPTIRRPRRSVMR